MNSVIEVRELATYPQGNLSSFIDYTGKVVILDDTMILRFMVIEYFWMQINEPFLTMNFRGIKGIQFMGVVCPLFVLG